MYEKIIGYKGYKVYLIYLLSFIAPYLLESGVPIWLVAILCLPGSGRAGGVSREYRRWQISSTGSVLNKTTGGAKVLRYRRFFMMNRKEDKFWKAKAYLYRIREAERRVELLERRMDMREDAGLNTDELRRELALAEQDAKNVAVEVTDVISRLADVNQQMVMTKRYVDNLSWERIAFDMNMPVRAVQKLHGRALPLLQGMVEEDASIRSMLPWSGLGDETAEAD